MEFDASCFGRDRIEQWLSWLRTERGCQPGTCNNRLASIRTFLKYLGHKEVRFLHLYQESMEIDRLKVQKKKWKASPVRLSKPCLLPGPGHTAMGRRDLVLMLVLYSTAAKIDEVLSMKVGQLHLDSAKPYVNIIGKGNKVRTLYLLPRTVAHLEKYLLDFHGNTPSPEAYVFYSRNTGIYGKLTAAAADKMFKKHAVKAHGSCADAALGSCTLINSATRRPPTGWKTA
ncbi:MAG: tyrosine-type recombinase/integrase [Enterocloster clostridioformis]